jgi:hypothetical protein
MAQSTKTTTLEKQLDVLTKKLNAHKAKRPKLPITIPTNVNTADEAFNKLITNSPAGSAQRQKYIDQKNAYNLEISQWQEEQKTIEQSWYTTRDAYQASMKLDPLLKKQQDNKDTGKADPNTDAAVEKLQGTINATPKVDDKGNVAVEQGPELRYGPNGESLRPNTPAYEQGSPLKPDANKPQIKPEVTSSVGADKNKGKVVTVDPKIVYTDALRETFKSLPKEYKSEIDNLLSQATKGKWKESAFMAELQKTQWWQTSLPSLQAYFIESHDPRNKGTFAETIRNNTDAVSRQLESLGINTTQVDPVTGKFIDNTKVIQGLASLKMMNGWTDAQFTQHLAENAQVHFSSGGTIGSSLDTIKRQALAYGISIDKNYEKQIQFSLLDPTDGRDAQYYLNEMKNQSIDTYKPFAESIKQGRSLYEVTSNYRTKMANLLETDSTNVTWQDLMGKVIDPTTGTARMESEFIKQVKKDPLWQYTKNAKETYSNTALDLMKQFGFIG